MLRYTLYGIGEGIRVQTDESLWASHQSGLITDASLSARQLAVKPGIAIKAALSLVPGLRLIEEEAATVRPVRRVWEQLYQFSPWMQTVDWHGFYLQVTGRTPPFEELREIAQALDELLTPEQRFRIGFAENPFLARALVEWSRCDRIPRAAYRRFGREQVIVSPALARGERNWLSAMPLHPLWIIPKPVKEQLHTLGVYTVEQLLALPGTMLRRRFGKEALVWLQSLAQQSDRLAVNYPPATRTAAWIAKQADALEILQIPHVLDGFAQELSHHLVCAGEGAMRVTLRWTSLDGKQDQYTRVAKHPIVRADFLLAQLLPACTQITEQVTELSLLLDGIRPLATEQLSFDLTESASDDSSSYKQNSIARTLLQINGKMPGSLMLGMRPTYRELRHHLTVGGSA